MAVLRSAEQAHHKFDPCDRQNSGLVRHDLGEIKILSKERPFYSSPGSQRFHGRLPMSKVFLRHNRNLNKNKFNIQHYFVVGRFESKTGFD